MRSINMAVTEVSQGNVQFPSDNQSVGASSKQVENGSTASSTKTTLQTDSLTVSDQEKGTGSKTVSSQSDSPTLPPPDESLVITTPKEVEAEVNPYFAQGAVMAAFWILMQGEIIPMMSKIRQLEKEYSITTREAKYDSSIEVAAYKEQAKLKEASQQFMQAIGSGFSAINSTITLGRQIGVDAQAENAFNTELDKANTNLTTANENLQRFKDDPAMEPYLNQVGENAGILKTSEQLMNDPNTPDNVKNQYKDLTQKQKVAQDTVNDMQKSKSSFVAQKANMLTQQISTLENILKSSVDSMINASVGYSKTLEAELQRVIGESEAGIELMSNYLQEQEKSADKASQAHSELLRTLQQSYQTYMSTLSGRA